MAEFDQIFASDPNNPQNVAENGVLSIYAPGTRSLLSLRTVTGDPLSNPLQLNGRGFGPAFMVDGYTEVAWEAVAPGEVFTGTFKSYKGVLEEALAAKASARDAVTAVPLKIQEVVASGDFRGPAGKDGANVVPTAQAIAAETAPLTAKIEATAYANAATAANTRRLINKLNRGVNNASILHVGDSTGNEMTEHVYLEAVALGKRFPAYTVTIAFWDEVGKLEYKAPATIQTGTSAVTLTIWNCAASGEAPEYVLGSRWGAAVAVTNPDIVFISHSHNMSDPGSTEGSYQLLRNRFMALTEEIAATFPLAGIVLESQNPTTVAGRTMWQAKKADILEQVSALRGYGFIDVHQAFMNTGNPASYISADGVHPNAAGSQLWASVVDAALREKSGAGSSPLGTPPLLTRARNFLDNAEFTNWSGALPDGWSASNCTATKETALYESGVQAMRLAPVADGAAYVQRQIDLNLAGGKGMIDGQMFTLAVRVRVPASHAATLRVMLLDGRGAASSATQDSHPSAKDRFMWLFCTNRMGTPAGYIIARIAARTTGAAATDVIVDRCFVIPGVLPNAGS